MRELEMNKDGKPGMLRSTRKNEIFSGRPWKWVWVGFYGERKMKEVFSTDFVSMNEGGH